VTFAKIFDWRWEAWNLRNPFYPFVFIYSIQALLHSAGIVDPRILVFAGRLVVALFSCLNIWIVFKIAQSEYSSLPIATLSSFFLAISHLHTKYGSTELPRTVSTFFLLIAVWLIMHNGKKFSGVIASAVTLGISAAMRFSEALFILPLALFARSRKGLLNALLLTIVFGLSLSSIIGITDLLYWGKPFFSLYNNFDYTISKGLSSRGYQPIYEYLKLIPDWTNFAFVFMILLAFRSLNWQIFQFVWIPIVLLSFLPHKESRYLLPVISFFSICLAASFWNLLQQLHSSERNKFLSFFRKPHVILILLCVGILLELDGFRVRRTEAAVDMARFINEQGTSGAAIQQIWKTGGRIYMPHVQRLDDISPEFISDPKYLHKKISDPGIQFVALQKKDVKRYGYSEMLIQNGYQEASFPTASDRNEYLLFRRHQK
jgi:hypothetical protein